MIERTTINGMRIIAAVERHGDILGGGYAVLLHRENGPFTGKPFVGAGYWDGKSDDWEGGYYDMDLPMAMDWLRHRTPFETAIQSVP